MLIILTKAIIALLLFYISRYVFLYILATWSCLLGYVGFQPRVIFSKEPFKYMLFALRCRKGNVYSAVKDTFKSIRLGHKPSYRKELKERFERSKGVEKW